MKNSSLKEAIKLAGGQSELSRRLGLTPQAVQSWTIHGIPAKWVIRVEKETGVSRHELRPDIYPR
jgi:DNA-binding transcriptional regulator YdaS (Cro superfamily)